MKTFQIYNTIPISFIYYYKKSQTNSLIETRSQKLFFFLFALLSVDGGWCEWSSWTPCSKTCGAEWVSRYRSCACPVPVAGGAVCPGQQEEHQGLGVQIERQPCPSVIFCPGDTQVYCGNSDGVLGLECTDNMKVHYVGFIQLNVPTIPLLFPECDRICGSCQVHVACFQVLYSH